MLFRSLLFCLIIIFKFFINSNEASTCGQGGTQCPLHQICIDNVSNQPCLAGPCLQNSQCQIIIDANQQIQNVSRVQNATVPPVVALNLQNQAPSSSVITLLQTHFMVCGSGGNQCPSGLSCVKNDFSQICASQECLLQKPICAPATALPCGKGGINCPNNQICMSQSTGLPCMFWACLQKNDLVCANNDQILCGKGGTKCPANQVCLSQDFTTPIMGVNADLSLNAQCGSPDLLPCGLGGLRCDTGLQCILNNKKGLCASGNTCTRDQTASCQKASVLACGQGGISCTDPNQVCVQSHKQDLCTDGACLTDPGSSCALPQVLPCGVNGGTTCPQSIDPQSQTACLWNNPATKVLELCVSGDCTKNKIAMCQLLSTLPCGKGGAQCQDNQICAASDKQTSCTQGACLNDPKNSCITNTDLPCSISGGTQCPKASNPMVQTVCLYYNKSTPMICSDTNCSKQAACKIPIKILPCGAGGTACPVNQYCITRDKKSLCQYGDCMQNGAICQSISQLTTCSQGGDPCTYMLSVMYSATQGSQAVQQNSASHAVTFQMVTDLFIKQDRTMYLLDALSANIIQINPDHSTNVVNNPIVQNAQKIVIASNHLAYIYSNGQIYAVDLLQKTFTSIYSLENQTPSTSPVALSIDSFDNLYFVPPDAFVLMKFINSNGTYQAPVVIAGTKNTQGYNDNMTNGYNAINAKLGTVSDMTIDIFNNIYLADKTNHVIRKLTPSFQNSDCVAYTINTLAGKAGQSGNTQHNGASQTQLLNQPSALSVDQYGNLFVADTNNNRIVMISAANSYLYTIAGSNTSSVMPVTMPTQPVQALSTPLITPGILKVDGLKNLYSVTTYGSENNNQQTLSSIINLSANSK